MRRSGRREGWELREGGGKREGAESVPAPHINPTAMKFLSAADYVLRVFPVDARQKTDLHCEKTAQGKYM